MGRAVGLSEKSRTFASMFDAPSFDWPCRLPLVIMGIEWRYQYIARTSYDVGGEIGGGRLAGPGVTVLKCESSPVRKKCSGTWRRHSIQRSYRNCPLMLFLSLCCSFSVYTTRLRIYSVERLQESRESSLKLLCTLVVVPYGSKHCGTHVPPLTLSLDRDGAISAAYRSRFTVTLCLETALT